MSLLDEMELTHADCALLLERLEGVQGNKAARLREKLSFLRDRTVDVLDTVVAASTRAGVVLQPGERARHRDLAGVDDLLRDLRP